MIQKRDDGRGSDPGNRPSVLVIEDDATTRNLISICMDAAGFNVIAVGALHSALEILASGFSPHVAIVDLHLPNGAGLDIVRALLAPDGRWPIVIVTGEYDDRWAAEAYSLHPRVQQYILKTRLNWTETATASRGSDGLTIAKFCRDAMARYQSHQRTLHAVSAQAVKDAVPSSISEKTANIMGLYGMGRKSLQWLIGMGSAGLVGTGATIAKLTEWPDTYLSPALVGATVCAFGVAVALYLVRTRK